MSANTRDVNHRDVITWDVITNATIVQDQHPFLQMMSRLLWLGQVDVLAKPVVSEGENASRCYGSERQQTPVCPLRCFHWSSPVSTRCAQSTFRSCDNYGACWGGGPDVTAIGNPEQNGSAGLCARHLSHGYVNLTLCDFGRNKLWSNIVFHSFIEQQIGWWLGAV